MLDAKVILENVGGLRGRQEFRFKSGCINIVKAPNAAGKTTIMKAIAVCLSVPLRNETFIVLAKRMGVQKSENEIIDPLVNISATHAEVLIEVNGQEWACKISRDGRYNYTNAGDERFLLTSIISRDSEILRRLTMGDTDFKWIAQAISLAERYEKVLIALEREIEKVNNITYQLVNRMDEIKELQRRIDEISERINSYRKEEETINEELNKLLREVRKEDISNITKYRDELLEKIKDQRDKISKIEEQKTRLKNEMNRYAQEYRRYLIERSEIQKEQEKTEEERRKLMEMKKEVENKLKNCERILKEISNNMDDLRREEGKLLAISEIYNRALTMVPKGGRITCPLCNKGYLTLGQIEKQKLNIEKKLKEIRDEIAKLVRKRNNLYSLMKDREEIMQKLQELKKKEPDAIRKRLHQLDQKIKQCEESVSAIGERIRGLEEKQTEEQEVLEVLWEKLHEIEEKVKSLGDKQERLVSRLGTVRGKISEAEEELRHLKAQIESKSTIKIDIYELSLDAAKAKIEFWSSVLKMIKDEIGERINRERVMAINLFNNHIKKVIKACGFDYLDVWVDPEDYRLRIIDKRIGEEITPRILSETEKYLLALVIHVVLKLAYTPDLPFFLIDEVMLSFDESRRRAILEYLNDLAKNNDWIIIITELSPVKEISVSQFITL